MTTKAVGDMKNYCHFSHANWLVPKLVGVEYVIHNFHVYHSEFEMKTTQNMSKINWIIELQYKPAKIRENMKKNAALCTHIDQSGMMPK